MTILRIPIMMIHSIDPSHIRKVAALATPLKKEEYTEERQIKFQVAAQKPNECYMYKIEMQSYWTGFLR